MLIENIVLNLRIYVVNIVVDVGRAVGYVKYWVNAENSLFMTIPPCTTDVDLF